MLKPCIALFFLVCLGLSGYYYYYYSSSSFYLSPDTALAAQQLCLKGCDATPPKSQCVDKLDEENPHVSVLLPSVTSLDGLSEFYQHLVGLHRSKEHLPNAKASIRNTEGTVDVIKMEEYLAHRETYATPFALGFLMRCEEMTGGETPRAVHVYLKTWVQGQQEEAEGDAEEAGEL